LTGAVNKYIGPESCYARNERAWVPRIRETGVTPENFWSVIALIIRDLRRGWGYGEGCARIPMTLGRALQRAQYNAALLAANIPDKEYARQLLRQGVEAVRQGRLPPNATVYLAGQNAEKLRQELIGLGIARPEQVKTMSVWEALAVAPP